MTDLTLHALPLTADRFAPFGDVIEMTGHDPHWINENTCRRYDDLAQIDVLESGGRPLVSIFQANPRTLPMRIRTLERHPLSSQAFHPLQARPFLVVVADADPRGLEHGIRAFLSSGGQGVNFRRNTWHHPLIALDSPSEFLVVDRGGPGENCEEATITTAISVDLPLPERQFDPNAP